MATVTFTLAMTWIARTAPHDCCRAFFGLGPLRHMGAHDRGGVWWHLPSKSDPSSLLCGLLHAKRKSRVYIPHLDEPPELKA